MRHARQSVGGSAILVIALLSGCANLPERNPVPESLVPDATIPGIPRARVYGDIPPPDLDAFFGQTDAELAAALPGLIDTEHDYLVISGGGANGAFGAGLLNGWTRAGTRPEFEIVTGISIGALIAPLVFLGPKYDAQLKELFTQYSTDDLVTERGVLKIITGDSVASIEPMRASLEHVVDAAFMAEIAAEFRKGRQLLIGTTNLDAGRPVIWNLGRIASSGQPDALSLIHDVILASASVPVAFPPVMIDVEADGQTYDEMHVDGGVTFQLFLYPMGVNWRDVTERLEVRGRPRLYVIRNGHLAPDWAPVERKITDIAGQTIFTLLSSTVLGDMYRVYLAARRDGIDYHLAYIPAAFARPSNEPFDSTYMQALFELGYDMARGGYPWETTPPGYRPEPAQDLEVAQ